MIGFAHSLFQVYQPCPLVSLIRPGDTSRDLYMRPRPRNTRHLYKLGNIQECLAPPTAKFGVANATLSPT